ncbi:hypothetical protein NL676_017049 [Syzygium grande]|nr:hypothetical protein NL676_017049 [Syzygium grande]
MPCFETDFFIPKIRVVSHGTPSRGNKSCPALPGPGSPIPKYLELESKWQNTDPQNEAHGLMGLELLQHRSRRNINVDGEFLGIDPQLVAAFDGFLAYEKSR